MTKKILSIFLILILLFSLTGCNKKNNSNDNSTSSGSQTNSDSNSGDLKQNSTSGSSSEITKVTIDDCKTAIDDTFKVMNYLSNKLPLLAHNSINIQFNSSTKKVRISPDSIFRKEITGILYKAASGHSSNSSQSYLLGEVLDTDIKGSIKYRKSSDFMINSINDNSDVNSKLLKIGDYLTQKKDFELYSYLQSLNDKHTTGDFYVSYLDELSEEKKTLIEAQYKNMLQIVTNFDVLKSSASNSLHVLHVVRYYNLLDDYYKNNNLKDYKAFADKHKAYTNCSYWDAYDNIGGVHYSPMDTLKDLVKSAN